jgi:hypothetical protein
MPAELFPTDPSGLPEAGRPELPQLAPGDTLELRVGPVAKRLGESLSTMVVALNAQLLRRLDLRPNQE